MSTETGSRVIFSVGVVHVFHYCIDLCYFVTIVVSVYLVCEMVAIVVWMIFTLSSKSGPGMVYC